MAFGIASYGVLAFGGHQAFTVLPDPGDPDDPYLPSEDSDYGTDHMSTTSLDIANAALTKLGADLISSLSEGTSRANTMQSRIEWCKWAVLRLHNWNFAQRRTTLAPVEITGTASGNGGKVRITAVDHGMTTGQYVLVTGVGGTVEANGNWYVSVIDDDTLDLTGSTYATAWTTGGKIGKAPSHSYSWAYDLPADFLRLTDAGINSDSEWRIESNQLLTDDGSVEILYIANVTNYGLMDVLFRECLATHLAIDTCIRITQSNQLLEQLTEYYKVILPKSRFVDATEDSMRKLEADEFVRSRFESTHF